MRISIIVVLLMMSIMSCENDPTLLTSEQIDKEIEKQSRVILDSLRPMWRDYCDTNFTKLVDHKVDSIVTEYIKTHPMSEFQLPPDTLDVER